MPPSIEAKEAFGAGPCEGGAPVTGSDTWAKKWSAYHQAFC